jgi:hypothetical protein
MSEILKTAFQRPHAINQNKNHHMVNKGKWPKYIWDFYPIAQDYYHEFNPYFVHLIYNPRIFQDFKIFTVRDGAIAFADFMVKNLKDIPKWKSHFLIPQEYTSLVPETLRPHFLSYSTSQVKKPDIRKAKTVTIFGLLCEQYYGSHERIKEKLSVLKHIAPDAKIEVCISQRRNPLHPEEKETLDYIQVPDFIRSAVGNREIKWLKLRDLMSKTVLRDHYLLDLMDGRLLTCDSYLHFWFLNRGGMVSSLPEWDKKPSLFDLDLSFGQKLHVKPLPEVTCQIAELIFVSKTTKDELSTNPIFHDEVRKIISTGRSEKG